MSSDPGRRARLVSPLRPLVHRFRESWSSAALTRVRGAAWRRVALEDAGLRLYRREGTDRPRRRLAFANAPHVDCNRWTDGAGHREVTVLRGALRLDPATGYVVSDGRLVDRSYDGYADRVPDRVGFRFRARQHVPRLLSLCHAVPDNYCHFLTILAPRLVLADRAGVPLDVPALVPAALARTRFFAEAVALGVFGGRPHVVQEGRAVVSANEIYTVWDSDPFVDAAEAATRLGSRPGGGPGHRRLYVDRSSAANGRQLDLAPLRPVLRDHGCDIVEPAHLSLREQVALFAEAALLVGPHGAGMGNMVFMPPSGSRVIEVCSPNLLNPWFLGLSAVLGVGHSALLAEATGRRRSDPVTIAPRALAAALAAVDGPGGPDGPGTGRGAGAGHGR